MPHAPLNAETLARAPKVLLHDHLDGGLRPATVLELAQEAGYRDLPADEPEALGRWFRESADSGSLVRYLETFAHTVGVMQRPEAVQRVARECALDLAADGVVYAEVRMAPELLTGMSLDTAVEAMLDGYAQGSREAAAAGHPIVVGTLLCAMRQADRWVEVAEQVVRHRAAGVVGFDLAGPEDGFPPGRIPEAIAVLDRAGAHRTIHAGEAAGIPSIRAPLAESAIVGTAIGAAVEGLRPIAEMQFSDFVSCGFDQLVNVAGKMHYRMGLSVNITVRLPSGGGFSGGPYHSQNPEAWFMHAPGLKIVAPSTAEDAKGLLIAAVRDPNPVLFMEHKHLYRRVKGEVPAGTYTTPFSARIAREGTDLTVIAYGAMVHTALEATADLDGSVEVLDLRSLVPLDVDAILASVRKTSKVVIVDEANETCAAGAQVAALIAERAWEDLDGPVVRVASPDVPIPFSPTLEQAVLPQVDDLKEACRELLEY